MCLMPRACHGRATNSEHGTGRDTQDTMTVNALCGIFAVMIGTAYPMVDALFAAPRKYSLDVDQELATFVRQLTIFFGLVLASASVHLSACSPCNVLAFSVLLPTLAWPERRSGGGSPVPGLPPAGQVSV